MYDNTAYREKKKWSVYNKKIKVPLQNIIFVQIFLLCKRFGKNSIISEFFNCTQNQFYYLIYFLRLCKFLNASLIHKPDKQIIIIINLYAIFAHSQHCRIKGNFYGCSLLSPNVSASLRANDS